MTTSSSNDYSLQPTNPNAAKLIYFSYLASIVLGITSFVGFYFCFTFKKEESGWLQSHYEYQFRTFIIAFGAGVLGSILAGIYVGYLILLAALVWYVLRCVKGLQALAKGEAIADPKTFLF